MSGYLLDTSFLSAFAPDCPPLSTHLQNWIAQQREHGSWCVSSIVIVEVERDIAKLTRSGGTAKAERIAQWFGNLLGEFDQRIISVDRTIAQQAGRMEDAAIARGRSPGLADILIAATAQVRGLTVLTANVRHFEVLETPYLNPFEQNMP